METGGTSGNTLHVLLERQRARHREMPFPDSNERIRRLRTMRAMLKRHQDEICQAIAQDFGCRPAEETRLLELFPSLDGIDHALRHVRRWMRPKRGWAGLWFLPARTELVAQPVGVVGIIVPWNYPLYLAVGPVCDALAAGNRVMVKMSEHTPAFASLFARLMGECFPEEEVSVVTGGVDVARKFSALPFDHLLFTGSTAVGRHVMRAAAENLTPVTLELGGKSPAIIGPGARFGHAVERILYGKCVNAGQTCIAPDYVLLPRSRQDDFIAAARAAFDRLYPEFAGSGQYASVIGEHQVHRLEQWRDQAVQGGAKLHVLGSGPASHPRIMAPTLVTDVDPDSDLMQGEIFGPLLPLVPYDDLEEALAFVGERSAPLALYLFEEDRAVQRRVLERQLAGGVTINDTLFHIAQHHLPFGGVGDSGMGAYHGEAGFRTFSKMKPVFRQARWNGVGLLNPPYGVRFRRMMKLLLRG